MSRPGPSGRSSRTRGEIPSCAVAVEHVYWQATRSVGNFMSLFSFKIAPGVRIRASSRGLRASIGPRAARVHVGAGGLGVSTGAGPMTLYKNLGGRRRARSSSSAKVTITARQRQLARAAKLAEAQQLLASFQAVMDIHRVKPVQVEPPVAPPPPSVDEAEIRSRHAKAAVAGIGLFQRSERARAKSLAAANADVEIVKERARVQEERDRMQADLDERWHALCSNDPDTVLATLNEAFEDNEAPAAALGVEADEIAIAVLVPPLDAIPERMPQMTAAGNLSMPKLPKAKRAGFYMQMVCGHLLATLRETFAVAPGVMSVRAAAVRLSEADAYGRPHQECLMAARFVRQAFEGVQWETADAARIVMDTSTDLVIRSRGQTRELLPLDLSTEPELAALLAAFEFGDPGSASPDPRPSDSAPPQYSPDGRWWWNGERWSPVSESGA